MHRPTRHMCTPEVPSIHEPSWDIHTHTLARIPPVTPYTQPCTQDACMHVCVQRYLLQQLLFPTPDPTSTIVVKYMLVTRTIGPCGQWQGWTWHGGVVRMVTEQWPGPLYCPSMSLYIPLCSFPRRGTTSYFSTAIAGITFVNGHKNDKVFPYGIRARSP